MQGETAGVSSVVYVALLAGLLVRASMFLSEGGAAWRLLFLFHRQPEHCMGCQSKNERGIDKEASILERRFQFFSCTQCEYFETDGGLKNCSSGFIPHCWEGYGYIIGKYDDIRKLVQTTD